MTRTSMFLIMVLQYILYYFLFLLNVITVVYLHLHFVTINYLTIDTKEQLYVASCIMKNPTKKTIDTLLLF